MKNNLNQTHDPELRSWVASANPVAGQTATDFPIQNLPHGVFRRHGSQESWRGGVAIGDQILDIGALLATGVLPGSVEEAASKAAGATLNDYMALPIARRRELRLVLSDLLEEGATQAAQVAACLVPQDSVELGLPVRIENFTDFYSSIHHATNVGALFRPDNPLLPNYKWLPVGYTGRTSSIRPSGVDVIRPKGQLKDADAQAPVYAPCRRLDYEVEIGFLIGPGNTLGYPIDIAQADDHIFGICLLNDWSARDIQSWEYQPLGPLLSKSFQTTLSPWLVTLDALEPFRTGFTRPPGDQEPLPHLHCEQMHERGSIDIRVQMYLQSTGMREAGVKPHLISDSRFTDAYWSMWQLVAHQTSNGTNLCPGDLLGSGTLSGSDPRTRACLLEMTQGGAHPVVLPNGEQRAFLMDGDTLIMRAYCEKEGAARIGFGECRATVLPAI